MDKGDTNFSEQPSSFILLPSQVETQEESDEEEDQMRHILTKLPALQPPKPLPSQSSPAKLIGDLGDTSTEEENKVGPSKVLVRDTCSEFETNQDAREVETSDIATVSESEGTADVTVIEKKTTDDSDMIADTDTAVRPSSPDEPASPVEPDRSGQEEELVGDRSRSQSSSPNESSFQSKDRSNLGSYDQCELYGTQKGHAHGQRFRKVASSQDDVFGDDDNDGDYVSTPAEHIGSLQLSLKPMLVPETVDETETEVPLSPPYMIPASPTDQEQTEEETMYNANEANTLADSSKGFNYSGSSSSSKSSGNRTVIEKQPVQSNGQEESVHKPEEQDFVIRPGGTLAGEMNQEHLYEQPESLHLHLSESHPSDTSSSNAQQKAISPERNEESLEVIEYVTETPKKRRPSSEVTALHSEQESVDHQSQPRMIRVATPKMQGPPSLPRELTKTPDDVIIIDSCSGHVVVEEEEEAEEQLSLRLSPSQGEVTQNNKIQKKTSSQNSRKGKKSRQNRSRDIYETPAVVWNNEELEFHRQDAEETKSSSGDRLSDEFHLTLPKDGDLLHPVTGKDITLEPEDSTAVETRQQEESETSVEPSIMDHPKSPTLTMDMITADSEAASEHVFRLEKPVIPSTDIEAALEETHQEDIFRRAKVKQTRKHWKYIQEEDSDDEYISPRPPQAVASPAPLPAPQSENTVEYRVEDTELEKDTLAKQQEVQQPELQDKETHELGAAHVQSSIIIEPSDQGGDNIDDVTGRLESIDDKTSELNVSVDHQRRTEMRPPSTPSNQDKMNGHERPKTPAQVQSILKTYSDIICKKTPLRQRSASVDISQLPGSAVKTSLGRQFSHDTALTQPGSLSQLQIKDPQSANMSSLVIQTQESFSNVATGSKGGAASPKGGSVSPKGASWMSTIKPSTESLPDEAKHTKNGQTSPGSNPPKSPKGIDIADIGQELLNSFKQSKKHRHHSGSQSNPNGKQNIQTNGSIKHSVTDNKSVQNSGSGKHPESKGIENVSKEKTIRSETVAIGTATPHMTGYTRLSGVENQASTSITTPAQGQGPNRTPLPKADKVISVHKPAASTPSSVRLTSKKDKLRQKTKRLVSSAERMRRRSSIESNTSAQMTTGSFVSSTQKFLQKETSVEPLSTTSGTQGHDPFTFQGSQSQTSPREMRTAPRLKKYTSSSMERTPTSSRKRRKIIHKKSGVKKQKLTDEAGNPSAGSKNNVQSPTSQGSDITVVTVGSLQSIPSSISQASPAGEPMLSPASSGSRSSTSGQTQRRLSIEPLPDTLQLQSEDDNYQRVTIVTKIVKRYIMETETERQVIGSQGQVLESSTTVQKGDPQIVEEKTHKKVQLIYMPSPSRSVSSLTSGDLADISSSYSRTSSSSLGSKTSITGGSFDHSQKSPDHPQKKQDQTVDVGRSGQGQGQKERGTTKGGRTPEFLEPQPSTSRRQSSDQLRKDTVRQKPSTPDVPSKPPSTAATPIIPPMVTIPSDTDGSDVGTPLGSTINKTGSYLHSRSVSIESPRPVEASKSKTSPRTSDSLFSSVDDKVDDPEKVQTRRRSSGTSDGSLIPAGQKRLQKEVAETDVQKPKSSGEGTSEISPEIPYQDQAISSSGTEESTALIPSTGEPGSRVMAKWKDGFYYPGTVKGKDRYGRFQVLFDDGDSLTIKTPDILLVEKLPVGQSVLVQMEGGDFESGMITEQKATDYTVETDSGSKGFYTQSQVILTADQASCLIADKGSEIMIELPGQQQQPANVGDVSLENLVDAPRRSAKKPPPPVSKVKDEDKDPGQTTKTRKRKFEALQPKATSTPTPKGKQDSSSPKKRKTATATGSLESPFLGATCSPVSTRRSPRKARVGLFTSDLGPIPTKKLFRGMLFLMTNVDKSAEQRKQEQGLMKDSSLESSTDESAVEDEITVPFDKNHLKAQIEAGGGKVLENFDVQKIQSSKKCFLLSSTYQRTIKYLQCLACGVPCVAHSWIVDSCTQDKLLDHRSYVLPAGISLEKKKLIEWKSKTDVFIGVKAFVSSKTAKFCECWSDILRLSKCTVLPKVQYSELDVIVTDSSCTQTMVRQAESHSVPLVSTEWVIQSLVNGKTVKYDGHPRYQHDFII